MRPSTCLLTIVFLLASPLSAGAVNLKDCDEVGGTRDRTECLQGNLYLLNSAFEAVTRELRKSTSDMRAEIIVLNQQVADLKAELGKIKPTPMPDLSNFITNGATVQIESLVWGGECLDHNTSNTGHIQSWKCHDLQRWKLNRK